jgi:hypothetical protein
VCAFFSLQDLAVRIKTERGRGGGAEDILYENLHGVTQGGIQLTSNYDPGLPRTNVSATPVIRRITIRNVTANTEARKKNQRPSAFLLLSNLVQFLCVCPEPVLAKHSFVVRNLTNQRALFLLPLGLSAGLHGTVDLSNARLCAELRRAVRRAD